MVIGCVDFFPPLFLPRFFFSFVLLVVSDAGKETKTAFLMSQGHRGERDPGLCGVRRNDRLTRRLAVAVFMAKLGACNRFYTGRFWTSRGFGSIKKMRRVRVLKATVPEHLWARPTSVGVAG